MLEAQKKSFFTINLNDPNVVILNCIIAPQPQAVAIGGDNSGAYIMFFVPYNGRGEVAKLLNFTSSQLQIVVMNKGKVQLYDKKGEPIEQGNYSSELASFQLGDSEWQF